MKPFEFKLKHERYINKRLAKMTNTDLLHYMIDAPDRKPDSFMFIFKRDVFMEMCFRYKTTYKPLSFAIMACKIQKRLNLPLKLNFKITDIEAEFDKSFIQKYGDHEIQRIKHE